MSNGRWLARVMFAGTSSHMLVQATWREDRLSGYVVWSKTFTCPDEWDPRSYEGDEAVSRLQSLVEWARSRDGLWLEDDHEHSPAVWFKEVAAKYPASGVVVRAKEVS